MDSRLTSFSKTSIRFETLDLNDISGVTSRKMIRTDASKRQITAGTRKTQLNHVAPEKAQTNTAITEINFMRGLL
jgi:hypothetical protein